MANLNQTTLGSAVKTEYEHRLLTRALPRLVHGHYGVMAHINGYGSYELRRYDPLPTVTTALTEGTTPAEQTQPQLDVVTLTPSFYGAWIGHSDILEMVAYDPIISEVSSILGEQCGLSADTIIRNFLTDNATKDYSNGKAGRSSLTQNVDLFTYADFIRQLAQLETQNARPADGEDYCVIFHPYDYATLMQDPTFVNLFIEEAEGGMGDAGGANDSALRSGYVGRILRCKIFVTSNGRSYLNAGNSNATPYSMLFIGDEAFGMVGIGNTFPELVDNAPDSDVAGGMTGQKVKPVEIIVKPVGSAGSMDPLDQRGTIGWKMSLAVQILNANWIRDMEHINAFS